VKRKAARRAGTAGCPFLASSFRQVKEEGINLKGYYSFFESTKFLNAISRNRATFSVNKEKEQNVKIVAQSPLRGNLRPPAILKKPHFHFLTVSQMK
jgi:hypothetical protein